MKLSDFPLTICHLTSKEQATVKNSLNRATTARRLIRPSQTPSHFFCILSARMFTPQFQLDPDDPALLDIPSDHPSLFERLGKAESDLRICYILDPRLYEDQIDVLESIASETRMILFPPINNLPDKVLLEIFKMSRLDPHTGVRQDAFDSYWHQEDERDCVMSDRLYYPTRNLSRVCKSWRNIVESAPPFCSSIHLELSSRLFKKEKGKEFLEGILTRAGPGLTVSLDINARFNWRERTRFNGEKRATCEPELPERCLDVLRILADHSQRFHALTLVTESEALEYLQNATDFGKIRTRLSQLESLVIVWHDSDDEFNPFYQHHNTAAIILFSDVHNLQVFKSIEFNLHCQFYRELHLPQNMPCLETLVVKGHPFKCIRDWLSRAPHLRDLRIQATSDHFYKDGFEDEDSDGEDMDVDMDKDTDEDMDMDDELDYPPYSKFPVTFLKNLTSLTLSPSDGGEFPVYSKQLGIILDHLECPNLETLHLDGLPLFNRNQWKPDHNLHDNISRFIARSVCGITTFSLINLPISDVGLLNLFDRLYNVVDLTIEEPIWPRNRVRNLILTPRLFKELRLEAYETILLTRLQALKLRAVPEDGHWLHHLAEMLISRWGPQPVWYRVAQTEFGPAERLDSFEIRWMCEDPDRYFMHDKAISDVLGRSGS
ncbi:hypothetical protein VKT23_010690 [Stygiomarasmius scandens]|uniref:F-box domain-containing protein n=1 Tax=Marasmiellus scandens TaxID=2682957 RepID=A0ABR1JF46_9AGAR